MRRDTVTLFSKVAVLIGLTSSVWAQAQWPQSPMPALTQTASGPKPLAPSDVAISPSTDAYTGHSKIKRGTPASTASIGRGKNPEDRASTVSYLCFEPGIGWTKLDPVSIPSGREAVVTESNTSDGSLKLPSAATARGRGSVNTVAASASCTSESTSSILQNQNGQISQGISKANGNEKTVDGRKKWLPDSIGSRDYSKTSQETNQWMSNAEMSSAHDDSAKANDTLKAISKLSYQSPIQLRRLSRNVQDLETRFKLRALQARLDKKGLNSSDDKKRAVTTAGGRSPDTKQDHDVSSSNRAPCNLRRYPVSIKRPCSPTSR